MCLTSQNIFIRQKPLAFFLKEIFLILLYNFTLCYVSLFCCSYGVLVLCAPPAEFSRESLLDAGGLKCPLSKDKMDCSNSTDGADPTSRQSATPAGTKQESDELPGEGFKSLEDAASSTHLDVVCLFIYVKQLWPLNLWSTNMCGDTLIHYSKLKCPERQWWVHFYSLQQARCATIKQRWVLRLNLVKFEQNEAEASAIMTAAAPHVTTAFAEPQTAVN